MPKYFMGGTRYEPFERLMMEVPKSQRCPEPCQKPKPREKKGLPCPKDRQPTTPITEGSD